MTKTADLVLATLHAIRADLAEIRAEQREQRQPLGAIERHLAHMDLTAAKTGTRLDRVLDSLDRIERRLELADAT